MEQFDWIKGFVLPYANFAIFLFLAFKFFKAPLRNILSAKRSDFEEVLKEANKLKLEAEEQSEKLKVRLGQLDEEVEDIRRKAQVQADSEAKEIVKSAEELAEHIRQEAVRMAEAEIKRARQTLQSEILAEVKKNVEAKIRQDVDEAKNKDIVNLKMKSLSSLRMNMP